MGTLNEYRLSDWYYTDNELKAMDAELLDMTPALYNAEPIKECIVLFSIVSSNGNTGKTMIVKTPDIILTMNALNRRWSETGLKFNIIKTGKLQYGADKLLDAIRIVLMPYKYETKFKDYVLAGNIYKYEPWMLNLI